MRNHYSFDINTKNQQQQNDAGLFQQVKNFNNSVNYYSGNYQLLEDSLQQKKFYIQASMNSLQTSQLVKDSLSPISLESLYTFLKFIQQDLEDINLKVLNTQQKLKHHQIQIQRNTNGADKLFNLLFSIKENFESQLRKNQLDMNMQKNTIEQLFRSIRNANNLQVKNRETNISIKNQHQHNQYLKILLGQQIKQTIDKKIQQHQKYGNEIINQKINNFQGNWEISKRQLVNKEIETLKIKISKQLTIKIDQELKIKLQKMIYTLKQQLQFFCYQKYRENSNFISKSFGFVQKKLLSHISNQMQTKFNQKFDILKNSNEKTNSVLQKQIIVYKDHLQGKIQQLQEKMGKRFVLLSLNQFNKIQNPIQRVLNSSNIINFFKANPIQQKHKLLITTCLKWTKLHYQLKPIIQFIYQICEKYDLLDIIFSYASLSYLNQYYQFTSLQQTGQKQGFIKIIKNEQFEKQIFQKLQVCYKYLQLPQPPKLKIKLDTLNEKKNTKRVLQKYFNKDMLQKQRSEENQRIKQKQANSKTIVKLGQPKQIYFWFSQLRISLLKIQLTQLQDVAQLNYLTNRKSKQFLQKINIVAALAINREIITITQKYPLLYLISIYLFVLKINQVRGEVILQITNKIKIVCKLQESSLAQIKTLEKLLQEKQIYLKRRRDNLR